jgi:hypothetical protein
MLPMPAFQIRDPVALFVLMEAHNDPNQLEPLSMG